MCPSIEYDLCCCRVNVYLTLTFPVIVQTGVVSRTFGIMPEKAFKMQAWIMVGRFMERNFEEPGIVKWLVAGAAAGAATTLIGMYVPNYI